MTALFYYFFVRKNVVSGEKSKNHNSFKCFRIYVSWLISVSGPDWLAQLPRITNPAPKLPNTLYLNSIKNFEKLIL